MTTLVWDAVTERDYEYGVDHGVISIGSEPVIPWNGLVSIDEGEIEAAMVRSYFDGRVYVNLQFGGFYIGQVKAFSFPYALQQVLGLTEILPGLSLTAQNREEFNFSYRTLINEDGYKIHLVYNATASGTKRQSQTIDDDVEIESFEWSITTLPPSSDIFRPTSHIIINTNEADPIAVAQVEDALYGTSIEDPYFPTQDEIISMFE